MIRSITDRITVVFVLVFVGLIGKCAYDNSVEKEALRNAKITELETRSDSLERVADSLLKSFRVETVTVRKTRTAYDSTEINRLARIVDSLRKIGKAPPETTIVEIPIGDVIKADSTIQACSAALSTCALGWANERSARLTSDSLLRLERESKPGLMKRTFDALIKLGVGFAIGRASK